ncbi:MAG: hypothetical protein K1X67_09225 [Fimbriimonadaceae bacterium]|nr:hypothetical protein [Fimbriimonadaceae bacterium]
MQLPDSFHVDAEIIQRLMSWGCEDPQVWLEEALVGCHNPEVGSRMLDRWLLATANPHTRLIQLQQNLALARLLLTALSASRQLADSLVQNPEFADLILDPVTFERPVRRQDVIAEAKRLVAGAASHSRSLDLLRFVRQKWILVIALGDLAKVWSPEVIWEALSELAMGLISATRDVAWSEFAANRLGTPEIPCPVSILAMGKLGGLELNYSSDVDLVYLLDDDADERVEREATRFCEALGRALADRMGRGALYRVDLRLRPFGGTGPIVSRWRAYESYARNYAEPWEQLAMIRSAVVAGSIGSVERLETLRNEVCFARVRGEWVFEELLQMRERVEAHAEPDDLKRGPGGIRDVEFLTQILQMLHGLRHPEVQVAGTLPALRSLNALRLIEGSDFSQLVSGYTLLRQTEHRCQIIDDRQTHRLPEAEADRVFIAQSLGFGSANEFEIELAATRKRIREVYDRLLRPTESAAQVDSLCPEASEWIASFSHAQAFLMAIVTNQGSAPRLNRLANSAPALLQVLRNDILQAEQIISGEIEEVLDPFTKLSAIPAKDAESMGRMVRSLWLVWATQRVVMDESSFDLSAVFDATFQQLAASVPRELEILALGSYASGDLGFHSDADLLLLCPSGTDQATSESAAQHLLADVRRLAQYGSPLKIDLRLRPDGGKGLLARTHEGLRAYGITDMELWERFALGRVRLVQAGPDAITIVHEVAYGKPLSASDLRELLHMKHRIESERVAPQHLTRQVKLGHGGLDDIDWLLQLHFMAYPNRLPLAETRTADRLRALAHENFLNAAELDELLSAHRHLLQVRFAIAMHGFDDDILPENPDKLERLGADLGFGSGVAFLAAHEDFRQAVRTIYSESIDRLARV